MKLSVIVVNYNISELLIQSLNSLIRAGKYIDNEIFVIKNISSGNTLQILKEEFPQLHFIAGNKNDGYSKIANQAIKLSKGEYVLLINADTISCKVTLEKIIEFMDIHTDAGGLNVRMVTPQGYFLPESKTGLTKAWVNFFKLTGLYKYFQKSRFYNRNHKDWIEEFETTEVDLLNGACMLLRRSVLNEIGLLDERFFMYGHDIDLSYRIRLAGYKNYYFAKTYIINFNTPKMAKFSWRYIKNFYGAMFIFAAKYLFKMSEINVKGIPQLYPPSYEVKP